MATEIVSHGILRPDGTIQLDKKPDLAAGPVEVVLRPIEPSLLKTLREIDEQQQARGFQGRSKAQIDADLAEQRAGDEKRLKEIHSHTTSPLPE